MEFKDYPKIIYTNVILKIMHSIHRHMLKSGSIDKIIFAKNNTSTYNREICLDSGMVMFIDSEFPTKFHIFNKYEIQIEINKGPSEKTSFINGHIFYNYPKEKFKEKFYSINKKRYIQMNCNLPIELVKFFLFPVL
jgi:hypothetical protein